MGSRAVEVVVLGLMLSVLKTVGTTLYLSRFLVMPGKKTHPAGMNGAHAETSIANPLKIFLCDVGVHSLPSLVIWVK